MREAQFLKQNADKWKQFESELKTVVPADVLADRFIELTDDLAYSKTFYPQSNTTRYLNGLATSFHQRIYRNKLEEKGRIWWFWQYELPLLFRRYHRQFLYSFLFFIVFCSMGALSARYDENFIRLILGDGYVNMTNDNIENGDPFGVYKHAGEFDMFLRIAWNNIQVSFVAYVLGATWCVGTLWLLMSNGLMLGSFMYFFFSKGLGFKSITVVFIHGTLEIWAIVIAGASGLILGTSILFPGTYSRGISFLRGGKDGLKIIIGLVPVFLTAALLEGYVTRHTEMPVALSLSILGTSAALIIWYFIVYPIRLERKIYRRKHTPNSTNNSFDLWLNKKFISVS